MTANFSIPIWQFDIISIFLSTSMENEELSLFIHWLKWGLSEQIKLKIDTANQGDWLKVQFATCNFGHKQDKQSGTAQNGCLIVFS